MAAPPHDSPRIVAVASGKGGVGKSLVTANVAIFLATLGKRVIVVDGSLGSPGLHVFAGVPRPSRTLSEALLPGGPRLADLTVPTTIPGLRLIGGTSDPDWIAGLDAERTGRLRDELRTLPADWVVLDLAAGSQPSTLELFLAADIPMLVAVPEPASIELMLRFLRAAFVARARKLGLAGLVDASPTELRNHEGGMISALEAYLAACEAADPRVGELRRAITGLAPQLVINQVRSKSDMEMGKAVAAAARRRLGMPIHYMGHLEYDEAVWASVRRRRPLLVEHPETRIAKCFERVARGLLAVRPPSDTIEVLPSDNHYDLLEVPPTASFEDIRRANRRVRDIYGAESVAISGLYDPATLEAVHRRLDLAYTTLMDAAKRKEYDQELFPDGVPLPPTTSVGGPEVPASRPVARAEEAVAAAARPPRPEIGPRTEFSGPLLRQLRESAGIELREIAERSKIGMAYLHALEEERWAKLPAPVYVRGFLAEYARILGLPADRVKEGYLARYRAARPSAEDDEPPPRRRSKTTDP